MSVHEDIGLLPPDAVLFLANPNPFMVDVTISTPSLANGHPGYVNTAMTMPESLEVSLGADIFMVGANIEPKGTNYIMIYY